MVRFAPPWRGKSGPDGFHPSALGYADWAAAVLASPPSHPGETNEALRVSAGLSHFRGRYWD